MPTSRCFLCEGRHLADECTTHHTLEERENVVETLKLCLHCLQPKVTDHLHKRPACKHCGKGHHPALCPLEQWRRGTTCAFCLEYHHSDACGKYKHLKNRLRAAETLKICRRCLSRSHLEKDCTSMHRCKGCKERHHYALCPNAVIDDTDEIEVIQVVQGAKCNSKKSSKGKTKQASSSSEYRKRVEKLKAEVSEGRRELRLAKEDKRRAERELDTALKERDDAQDKCKALEKKIHGLEEENRNCEAIRQVTAAAVEASIEIVTNREEERRRTIEQERDDAAKKLLEAEKSAEAFRKAASDAVRLTSEFQAWRIHASLKAKMAGISQKKASNDLENGSALPAKVATAVQETGKTEEGATAKDAARKRPSASSPPVEKRRRTDSVKPSAEELNQRLDATLGVYSQNVAEKYRLFFVENLRSTVTIEELVQFVSLRCPNDVDLAQTVLNSFTTP